MNLPGMPSNLAHPDSPSPTLENLVSLGTAGASGDGLPLEAPANSESPDHTPVACGSASALDPAIDVVADAVLVLPAETAEERYERLRDESREHLEAGRFAEALAKVREAHEIACGLGDEMLVARARCNVAAVALMTGEPGDHICDLRTILMRNHDGMTSFIAAYNLGYAYEQRKEYKKALFYGRIARDRARATGNAFHLANSLNQIGNSLLAESYFEDARDHYEDAVGLLPEELSFASVTALVNLGYCKVVLGEVKDGFRVLFRCLRYLRPRGMRSQQSWARLFVCAAYLQIGRVERAWLHGRRALAIAEDTGEVDAVKASLFMMGEVERTGGDFQAAYEYFSEVHRRFYPELDQVPQLLSVVGVTKVVNLRA
ncbi:MAG: tetratricopeptide repeat protein [Holophagales bacterium]|nr:tetratricopeptide repeat protein [Holophagales bacterium]